VIGVLLTGVAFFVFMALFAHRSVARMTTKAPSLAVALPAANRAEIPAALVERMIALAIVVVLTVLVRNPALPGCALGGGFGLLLTTHLMQRWQEQNHENLVVVRRPHNLLLPERPSFYRMPGD
jgi:hypothetical protein